MAILAEFEKRLGAFRLDVKLEAGGERMALFGASGCGKTMTLRCIAGVERPDSGRIVIDGETVFDAERGIDLPPQKRRAGLLFQSYALFPNMTVLENVRMGAVGCKREEGVRRAEEMLAMFGLAGLARLHPAALSGGEQQRAALARILVSRPRILMLDEPFSALDGHLRYRLEQEVSEVIRAFDGTVLFVSHDREEVYRMCDRVAVMARGRVESVADKAALFERPQTRTAALLTGCRNLSRLERTADGRYFAADWGVTLTLPNDTDAPYIGVHAHDIRLADGENAADCRVRRVIENPFTDTALLTPACGVCAEPFSIKLDRGGVRLREGDAVRVSFPKNKLLMLKE